MKDLTKQIKSLEKQVKPMLIKKLRQEYAECCKELDSIPQTDLEDLSNPIVVRWYGICARLFEADPEFREALDEITDDQLERLSREN